MKKFYKYVNTQFVGHPLQVRMAATCEDSPWHREADVWCHTNMVLKEFEDIHEQVKFNDTAANVGRFALLFHDTGKPDARTQKESAERGVYHSYPGHEGMSARELEGYAVDNWEMLKEELGFTDWYQMYAAAHLVEIHLPYDLKKVEKRARMATAVHDIETKLEAPGLFAAVLRSDARGRVSDDKASKLQRVEDWISEVYKLPEFA